MKVTGVVQGVGYRPYVYNYANYFCIKGWVSNHGSALVMDIEGARKDIKNFLLQVVKKPPDLATIEKVKVISQAYRGHKDFRIETSSVDEKEPKFIGMDIATCPDCLREIFNPLSSRYQYPFTTCTACGPRYSMIKQLPFDRKNTTMNSFQMCPTCHKEYTNPSHRRFHAQANCCPDCGPTLRLLTQAGEEVCCDDPIRETIRRLKQGKIVAIKGLGGFHLTCDAKNEEAVVILRKRKNRPHKPFAIMVKDVETAKSLCFISEKEEKILSSNKRPILLLRKKENSILSDKIAPNINRLGIMLPYTPLHYLLFQKGISSLVMTSGNRSTAPIQYKNRQAIKQLRKIVDYFLIHNREIYIPVEDSVVKVIDDQEVIIRKARGYTPYIFDMKGNREMLALGAEQKNTFCLSQNGYGYMSQYIGDLTDLDTYMVYKRIIAHLTNLLGSKPKVLIHDLHPRFLSTQYAMQLTGKKMSVQHHHAHMVSCMVEHHLFCPVIGVIFDGTGLGTDGNLWGGEFFIGTREKFFRVGHFQYVSIQGGDQSIRQPWRVAVSDLHSINYDCKDILTGIDEKEIDTVKQALDNHLNCYKTSSVGRLFDGVAALLNLCREITYDAQAAIELENHLDPSVQEGYAFYIGEQGGVYTILYKSILLGILEDIKGGISTAIISAKFHNTIGNITVDLVCKIGKRYGIKEVVFSGGVFENDYLLVYILKKIKEKGFIGYYHQKIPTNDSGISVGQLAIAQAKEGK